MSWAERFSALLNSKAWTEIPWLLYNTFPCAFLIHYCAFLLDWFERTLIGRWICVFTLSKQLVNSTKKKKILVSINIISLMDPCLGGLANYINLLLALPDPSFLAELSGTRVGRGIVNLRRIRGQNAPGFAWATFGWTDCIINTNI